MENLYEKIVRLVGDEGARFAVNFSKRNLKVNGELLIENGVYDGELGVEKYEGENAFGDIISDVEELYDRFKHSRPTTRSMSKRRGYFVALPEDRLNKDDLLFSENRDVAQVKLELYILCQIINGWTWTDDPRCSWCWKNPETGLVIYKHWIEKD